MKKFLSLVLALVMTMSLVTVSAGAKDFTDSSKIQYTEAVDVMSAVKVIDGYAEGDFRPSTTLTRGAAAKIICNLILGPTTAGALVADAAPYKDVPTNHTFAGYIAYCQKEGIISGYADGTFRPANSLTGYAFMKMLLGALGYDAEVEGYTGPNWSVNVAKRALNIGLADDLNGEFNGVKAVNREEACLYALNTLTADMVEYDAKTTVSTNGTTVVIAGSKAKEMVNNGNTDGKIFTKDGVMQFAEKYFDNLTVKTGSDDFSRPANVWKVKAEEIGTYTNTPDASYTKKVEVGDIYKDLGLGSKIEKKNVSVYVDGVANASQPAYAITKGDDANKYGDNGVLTEVFYDDDAETVTITEINTYIDSINKTVKATDKKDAYVVVTAEGPVPVQGFDNEFETDEKFEDDAYVLYTYSLSAKEIKSVELAKKVEGKVTVAENSDTNNNDKKALTIDGTRYKAAKMIGGENLADVSVKQDYTIYVDSYGYMIYVEENEEIGDYALILNIKGGSDWYLGNRVELLFTDGTTKIVTTDKDYAAKKGMTKNQIVTYKVNDGGEYTLKALDSTKTFAETDNTTFKMENDKAGIIVKTVGSTNTVVTANSASQFVVRDTNDTDDYTAYTGIKNAPSITAGTVANKADVDVYYYCKSGKMVTVMFIMTSANTAVEDDSSNALFIAKGSVSNLIHDNDGDYFTYSAVVNGEIKTVKVASDVKVGNVAIYPTSKDVKDNVGGLYKSYSVDKHGIITNLNTYTTSANGTVVDTTKNETAGVYTGIKKTSKEYTISVGLKADGSYTDILTVGDDAKIFYVNDDDEISVSSYNAIAEDSNDKIHVVLKDYVVKTLVIYEKSGNTTNNSQTLNPGEKPVDAQLVGSDLYINVIDNDTTAAANAATKVLKDAGYRRIDLSNGEAIDANGDYFYFDTITTNYYTLKVDGEVVEYIKKNAKSETTLGQIQGEGTGYIKDNGASVIGYSAKTVKTEVVSNATAATVIETGYVNVNTNSVSDVSVEAGYAKVGSTVKVTYTGTVAANESLTLTYNTDKTVDAVNKVFSIKADKDITLVKVDKVATYTVAAPTVSASPVKGLTVTAVADKTSAKAGEKVTVTVTIKGEATGDATLTISGASWLAPSVPTGVTYTSSTVLTVNNGTNLGDGVTAQYTITVSADVNTNVITVA
jgi:hypothetical protein